MQYMQYTGIGVDVYTSVYGVSQAKPHGMHDAKRIQGLVRTLRCSVAAGALFKNASWNGHPLTPEYIDKFNRFKDHVENLETWLAQHGAELVSLSDEHYDQNLGCEVCKLKVTEVVLQSWRDAMGSKAAELESILPGSTLLDSPALFTEGDKLALLAKAKEDLAQSSTHKEVAGMLSALQGYKGAKLQEEAKLQALRLRVRKTICVEWAVSSIVSFAPSDPASMIAFAKNIREQMVKKGAGKMFQVPGTIETFLRKIEEQAKKLEAGHAYVWRVLRSVYPLLHMLLTFLVACIF